MNNEFNSQLSRAQRNSIDQALGTKKLANMVVEQVPALNDASRHSLNRLIRYSNIASPTGSPVNYIEPPTLSFISTGASCEFRNKTNTASESSSAPAPSFWRRVWLAMCHKNNETKTHDQSILLEPLLLEVKCLRNDIRLLKERLAVIANMQQHQPQIKPISTARR